MMQLEEPDKINEAENQESNEELSQDSFDFKELNEPNFLPLNNEFF